MLVPAPLPDTAEARLAAAVQAAALGGGLGGGLGSLELSSTEQVATLLALT